MFATWVTCFNGFRVTIVSVDGINKKHARVTIMPSMLHNIVPQISGFNGFIDFDFPAAGFPGMDISIPLAVIGGIIQIRI